jgi:hypothetical protein
LLQAAVVRPLISCASTSRNNRRRIKHNGKDGYAVRALNPGMNPEASRALVNHATGVIARYGWP